MTHTPSGPPEDADTFDAQLREWRSRCPREEQVFAPGERKRLAASRASVRPDGMTVVTCCFENRFAAVGGLAHAAALASAALVRAGRPAFVLTPWHGQLAASRRAFDDGRVRSTGLAFDVPFADGVARSRLLEDDASLGARTYFIQCDEAPFFAAQENPYSPDVPGQLLQDSLFLSRAVPAALQALGVVDQVVLHLQDWETAPTALTFKQALLAGHIQSGAAVFTCHNPYDAPTGPGTLARLGARPASGSTVLEAMLPLMDGPLTTVSRVFARELVSDPLQAGVFVPHLQGIFAWNPPVGIDNGPFRGPAASFTEDALARADRGDWGVLAAQKDERRREMLEVLDRYRPPDVIGSVRGQLGGAARDLPPDLPVFFWSGRMDTRMKGLDVLAVAARQLPAGTTKFVVAVQPEGGDIGFLEDWASQRPGDVVVYPFRMSEGYLELQRGATFAVMPSFFEPFGSIHEAALEGTPAVARATGGLMGQVVPWGVAGSPTGILYREAPSGWNASVRDWRAIIDAADTTSRRGIPTYDGMVAHAAAALEEAALIWREDRPGYLRMVRNGIQRASLLSWDRAAAEYEQVFRAAVGC